MLTHTPKDSMGYQQPQDEPTLPASQQNSFIGT